VAGREGERLVAIEALRGFAALGVAWFHLTLASSSSLLRLSGYEGRLGVPVFFVISGFVIPYSMWRMNYKLSDFWRFLGRRLVRLEPSYLASIVVAISLGSTFTLPQLASHLFYLTPLTPYQWIVPVYWTLCYEFVFYISCGLLLPALGQRHIGWILVLGAITTLLLPVDHEFHGLIPCFVIGIAAARYFGGRDSAWTCCAAIGSMLVLMLAIRGWAPALVAAFTALTILFVRAPGWRWISVIAALSYPLYLLHQPIGGLAEAFVGGPPLVQALASLAACVLAAGAMHILVERPSLFLSKKIRFGHPSVAPKAPAA
jgi:peptidoglycan/LPS O-acetylase OafA/YrhL